MKNDSNTRLLSRILLSWQLFSAICVLYIPKKGGLLQGIMRQTRNSCKNCVPDYVFSGKDPLGWSIMCWLSWFSGPGCWWCPTSRASSRSLKLCPWPSICFHGPSSKFLDLLPPTSLPPVQKRDAQHMFCSTRVTRRVFVSNASGCMWGTKT